MKIVRLQISAITVALIMFLSALEIFALPLTETIYMIPEYDVEIYSHEEVHNVNRYFRKDVLGVGFGATSRFALWIRFEYVSQGIFRVSKSDLGDLFLKSKFFIGDFFNNIFHLGFLFELRFPVGKNAYASETFRNLALGKSEIKLGPLCQIDIVEVLFLHMNVLYVFREGSGEDFYGGFYINPFEKKTWEKFFGLNPKADNTFFNVDRWKNDFIAMSLAINTDIIYPVIPYIEIYGSFRVSSDDIDTDDVPIEGGKYNPLLLSAGLRFFFLESIYLGLYTVQNPLQKKQPGFLKAIYGLELSFQF